MANRPPIVQESPTQASTSETTQNRRANFQLDEQTAYLLTRLYMSRRVDYQLSYYQVKAKEHDNNSDLMFRLGAIIMTLSSLLATIGATQGAGEEGRIIALATALLPAFAALIASFRQLYQWDRQASLYRDTILGLEEAALVAPDLDALDPRTSLNVIGKLVDASEEVFKNEVDQWGQLTMPDEEANEEARLREFAELYGFAILDDSGEVDQKKLESLRSILAASNAAPEPGIPQIQSLPPTQRPALTASSAAASAAPQSPTRDTPATNVSTPLTPERPLSVSPRRETTTPVPPASTTPAPTTADMPPDEPDDVDDALIPPAPDDSSRFEFDDAFEDLSSEMFDDDSRAEGGGFEDVDPDDFPQG